MTLLEKIEALVGTVTAYDGRLCLWANAKPYDVRDIALRVGAHPLDVMAAMPIFERAKRGRAKLEASEPESEEQ